MRRPSRCLVREARIEDKRKEKMSWVWIRQDQPWIRQDQPLRSFPQVRTNIQRYAEFFDSISMYVEKLNRSEVVLQVVFAQVEHGFARSLNVFTSRSRCQ